MEAAVESQQPGSRPKLERILKEADNDFRFHFLSSRSISLPLMQELIEEPISKPSRFRDVEKGINGRDQTAWD